MAGKYHFSGKIMTASQHSGSKRSEQLLQSLAVGTNRFLPGTGPSLQQNQHGRMEKRHERKEREEEKKTLMG